MTIIRLHQKTPRSLGDNFVLHREDPMEAVGSLLHDPNEVSVGLLSPEEGARRGRQHAWLPENYSWLWLRVNSPR